MTFIEVTEEQELIASYYSSSASISIPCMLLNEEPAEETRHEGKPDKNTANIYVSSWPHDFIPKQKSYFTSKPETALKRGKLLQITT